MAYIPFDHLVKPFSSGVLAISKPYVQIGAVNTTADTPAEISSQNIPQNIARGYPRLHQLSEFGQKKLGPVALIGGGPSLKDTLDLARRCPVTVACGSVHDFLMREGLLPTYCVVCDPDPIMAEYLRSPSIETTYLVSSHCHSSVFDALHRKSIALWHCHPVGDEFLRELEGADYQAVGGGCTVGLRALSIAIMLGYTDIHFFGFDSSLGFEDAHHAYGFATDKEETGNVFEIKIGRTDLGPDETRAYRCAGYQLAQVDHFKRFAREHGSLFRPTFHGSGLLPDLWRLIEAEAQSIQDQAAA